MNDFLIAQVLSSCDIKGLDHIATNFVAQNRPSAVDSCSDLKLSNGFIPCNV